MMTFKNDLDIPVYIHGLIKNTCSGPCNCTGKCYQPIVTEFPYHHEDKVATQLAKQI